MGKPPVPNPPQTHAEAVARWLKVDGIGIEIGAFKNPVPGIKPFYVDRCATYAHEATRADIIAKAHDLPFRSHSLDYVVASHVFEHLPNPVAALAEWHRVLRPGGHMYLVVPDRRFTFDHPRALTDPEHMWQDYLQGTGPADPTHIDEFVDGVDWTQFAPQATPEERVQERERLRTAYRVASNGGEIDIHFHVFEPTNLRSLVELVGNRLHLRWKIVTLRPHFPIDCPNGILLIVRVAKGLRARLEGWRHCRQAQVNREHVLLRSPA